MAAMRAALSQGRGLLRFLNPPALGQGVFIYLYLFAKLEDAFFLGEMSDTILLAC